MFASSTDYHELNAGAHRNSSKNLFAPALTWHFAIWAQRDQSDDVFKKKIDELVLTLCRGLKASRTDYRVQPCVQDRILLFKTVASRPDLVEIDAACLTERQEDIFKSGSRSAAIVYRWVDLDMTIRIEAHTEYVAITIYAELDKRRQGTPYSSDPTMNSKIDEMLGYFVSPTPQIAGQLNDYFFSAFWDAYLTHLRSLPGMAALCRDALLQHVFADFRGIIISDIAVSFSDQPFFKGLKPPCWGAEAKQMFLPLLREHPLRRLRNYECAVNYLADGRALYMSTLAPQLPEAPVQNRIPLQYIVFVHHRDHNGEVVVNKWHLGRLISLLHYLGTSRLAALKDVKHLHDAGKTLSRLDEIIQKARDGIISDPSGAMMLIKKAHQGLDSITGLFLHDAMCGLSYRIERSRYYVSRLKLNLPMLRIAMLEGDQSYDQFIERRIGAQFDYINRLGIRFERAINNLNLLDQQYVSMKIEKVNSDSRATNETIKQIQIAGELVLIGALVPYYVSHMLSVLFLDEYTPIITTVIWGTFLSVAIYRGTKNPGLVSIVLGAMVLFLISKAIPAALHPKEDLHAVVEAAGAWQKQILEEQKAIRNELTEQRKADVDRLQKPGQPPPVPALRQTARTPVPSNEP